MNDLSLFLYAVDIVQNVSVFLGIIIFLFASCFPMFLLYHLHEEGELYPHWGKFTAAFVVLSLVLTLLPSKDTMYAIAASQLGEQAVKSQIGQKTISALEAWLDKQVEKKQ